VLMVAARRRWRPLLIAIPVLWCLLGGAMAWGLNQPLAWSLPVLALVGVTTVVMAEVVERD
ncbi:MAG: hypothetical protein R3336_09225, partial [Phycisphaeraceae bacterium]|nr:hypothetical protein [Phycisphaeraceae bacterium]